MILKPKSSLPWKDEGIYSGNHKNFYEEAESLYIDSGDGYTVITNDYDFALMKEQDRKYMLQACNNFPKAIELLREAADRFSSAAWDENVGIYSDYSKQIEEFLDTL